MKCVVTCLCKQVNIMIRNFKITKISGGNENKKCEVEIAMKIVKLLFQRSFSFFILFRKVN